MRSLFYRKPLYFLIIAVILFCTVPIFADNYSDDHNDGNLNGWTVFGDKVWSESGGYAVGQNSNGNGFLIRDNDCANDGTFIFKIKGIQGYHSQNGGGIFRYSDISHFYYVYLNETNTGGTNPDNALIFCKNRLDKSGSYTIVKGNLNLSGMNSEYTIKVELSGSTFTFWWYKSNTWDSLGQVTDYEHSSGKVGYAVNHQWNPQVEFDFSSWEDAGPIIEDYTWDTSSTPGIQAGNGTWGTDNYWTPEGEGTILVAWPGAGRSATFAGSDGSYTITVNDTQRVDSIAFMNDGYTLNNGVLDFNIKNAIYVAFGKTATVNSTIRGYIGLSKYGSGTLILTGTNTYWGKTTIDEGVLQVGNGSTGSINIYDSIENNATLIYNISIDYPQAGTIKGTGTVIKQGSGNLILGTTNTFTDDLVISSGSVTLGAGETSGSITANVINNGSFYINRSNDYTFSYDISGTGQLIKQGSGKLILTGSNTYTGTTQIATGSLQIGNGGTEGTVSGDITNSQILYFNRSDSYVYESVISGTGSVVQSGIGMVTLSGNNTYSGVTTINDGTLRIGNGGTTGAISSSSNITNNSALIIDRYGSYTYSGVISGTGTVTKSGDGIFTLSNDNTYSGITTVSEGTLNITGSLPAQSSVNVNSDGVISGTGTVNGTVTVSGGTVSPGNQGTGTLTTGSLTLDNSSVLDFELGNTKDSLKVNGNLVLDGNLKITETEGFGAGTYTLISYTGSLTDNGIEIDADAGQYSYLIEAGDQKVVLVVQEQSGLLPITVKSNTGSGSSDTCLIYTDDWSVVFDESTGGQIRFLSDQPDAGGTNQVANVDINTLFSVSFGENSYNVTANLELVELSSFHAVLHNKYDLYGLSFTEEYTVYGSGLFYVKVIAVNSSGSSQTQSLQFISSRKNDGNSIRITKTSTASTCPYLLNAESSDNQFDILMAIKELWTNATGFVSTSGNNSILGFEESSCTFTNNMYRSWEFMIDFSKKTLIDTSSTTNTIANNFICPDTLEFITGTVAMERAWEHYLRGHWTLDDETGDTARDYSGNNRHASASGTWTSGMWDGGLQVTTGEQITYPDDRNFDGVWHFTVMAWIKTSTLNENTVIIGKHNGSDGWKLTGNSSGKVALTLDNTVVSGKTGVADNQWHHVAAAFSTKKDTVKIYVDGIADTVVGGSFTVSQNISGIIMGGQYAGILDDIRYYDEKVSENTLKGIYQLGYRSSSGLYQIRADNNNTVHLIMHGGTVSRYYPIFKIENYWASSKPQAGCVVLDGTALTENSDYYVYFNSVKKELVLGLNKILNNEEVVLYIDDSYSDGSKRVNPVRKMSWGIDKIDSRDYVWVKNFEGSSFGSPTSNQWYINWNMGTSGSAHQSRDGEIWYMASSVEKAYTEIDTTSSSLIPGSESQAYHSTMGGINLEVNSKHVRTTENINNSFTYTIEESSAVRVKLRINERNAFIGENGYDIVTKWTLYPSGQIFRYDSIYNFTMSPSRIYYGWFMDDQTNATIHTDNQNKRAGVIYSGGYPDYAVAWLSMRNDGGYQGEPFESDTLRITQNEYRSGFDFYDASLSQAWNSSNIEMAVYLDLQHTAMSTASIDSFGNGVQHIGIKGSDALIMLNGTINTTTMGDLNEDGFNETEGAYIISAENNTVNFKLPAEIDTCRFYPAFRITNYFASSKPLYVILYKGTDTASILEGYQYNAYHNKVKHELVMQIDSVFCDTVGIYISADQTLAVKMSGFWGNGGDGCDTLFWRTESEQDNLGFLIYRRIKPLFYDSTHTSSVSRNSSEISDIANLIKKEKLKASDTLWTKITEKMIPGSPSGVSHGTRNYKYLDFDVINNIAYEYKLAAIDYNSSVEEFGPVELMPFKRIPAVFRLHNNYPNPFRKATVIKFELPEKMRISLNIYNIQGRLVKRLIHPDKPLQAVYHQVLWDGLDDRGRVLSAGPYIYRLSSEKYVKARIMIKLE